MGVKKLNLTENIRRIAELRLQLARIDVDIKNIQALKEMKRSVVIGIEKLNKHDIGREVFRPSRFGVIKSSAIRIEIDALRLKYKNVHKLLSLAENRYYKVKHEYDDWLMDKNKYSVVLVQAKEELQDLTLQVLEIETQATLLVGNNSIEANYRRSALSQQLKDIGLLSIKYKGTIRAIEQTIELFEINKPQTVGNLDEAILKLKISAEEEKENKYKVEDDPVVKTIIDNFKASSRTNDTTVNFNPFEEIIEEEIPQEPQKKRPMINI